MKVSEQALASIIVITYNSSKYVLETLESAKAQTYKNIELIISDDCSTDDTIEICRDWIEKNNGCFVRTKLISQTQNSGVSANCNRGVYASKGKWIKIIAGDDILCNNCIEQFIRASIETKHQIFACKLNLFSYENAISANVKQAYEKFYAYMREPLQKQKKRILSGYFVPGPGLFFNRKLFDLVKGFDEKYPFSEEWPFVLRIIHNDFKVHLIEQQLVNYRVSTSSLSTGKHGLSQRTFNGNKNYFFDERRRLLIKNLYLIRAIEQTRRYHTLELKYSNGEANMFKILFWTIISPRAYFIAFKKIINVIQGFKYALISS
jgi:alpha-1,3-rhamnosyltransferase